MSTFTTHHMQTHNSQLTTHHDSPRLSLYTHTHLRTFVATPSLYLSYIPQVKIRSNYSTAHLADLQEHGTPFAFFTGIF